MLGFLGSLLRPDQARLDTLERQVATLVAEEQARAVAFLDIADRVKRHLGRVAAIEGRAAQREQPIADPVTLAVLSSKFPQRKEG